MTALTSSEFVSALQKAVIALENNLGGKVLVLDGKAWKEGDFVKAIQAVIDAVNEVATTRAAWAKAVADAKTAKAGIVPLMLALRGYVQAMYGAASTVFADFGFTSRKQGKPSATTVALRVLKNLATRKARMTMSKKRKQNIKGVVTSSDVAEAVTSAAAPGVQPAASAVQSNVPGTSTGTGNGSTH
jgi:hypothetical protein